MGFFFTLLFISLLYIRPQEFWELLQDVASMDFVAGAAIIFVFLEGSFNKQKFANSPMNKLLVFFWVWLALIWIPNGWLGGVVDSIQRFGKTAILYYLIVLTVDSFARLRILLWTLALVTTLLAIDAIVLLNTGFSLLGGGVAMQRSEGEDVVMQARGLGIFSDPNDMAIHIVPMVAFMLPAFFKRVFSGTFIPGIILMIPMITGIVYTRSRGGILALALVAWYYLRDRVGIVFSVVGLVMLGGLLMAIPRMGTVSAEHGSAQSRFDHWAYGLQQFMASPIWGMGYKNFTGRGYKHTAHNSFILIVAETGIVGTYLWIGMFIVAFIHLSRLRKTDRGPPWLYPLANGMQAAMLGWMLGAFFLSQSYAFLLFIMLGIITATVNIVEPLGVDASVTWSRKETLWCLTISVGGILLMHALVRALMVVT